ncbi:DegT/DnrJ/EryC1/StrS family aminotransferase [Dyadobacter sp. LHD-138]|uniref:DegT/DnrJ/EryC1/StrS family aminotransferase n=1 Tax=Dyadobacter sp. LHD-138 TaxID=3071413 RepID=UPI0027DEF84F|nr:DegT/DnrJ/EryC1/StrS family aminotransferase [Dyadobacter sp. LHD-138]MDQ6477248.1 DegT/DnrJ/EryC1/StrS family aminotransferase [Dyadobacter sp. LHD-138]
MTKQLTRREFIKRNALTGLASGLPLSLIANHASQPAILGGQPAWNKGSWPIWPQWNPETDEKELLSVIRSGIWSRATAVTEFEKRWANAVGTQRCLALVNGTNALVTALAQFNIQAGDEVIVPPYTFIATVTAVLSNGALPVFVDVDPETFQIDPAKIEAKITPRTKAIIPVHILGLPADMAPIMAIAKKHNLIVIEDACQAHLAEYQNKKVGSIGDAGCFSFQNSKNLAVGEGGAIVSNNNAFMDRCYSYTNFGNPYGTPVGSVSTGSTMQGTKLRWTEYQAAIGLAQLQRLDAQTTLRNENAAYLKSKIKDIPGIRPYRLYDHVTKAAFHLFPFRYDTQQFKGLSRADFLEALRAEDIPCSSGYTTLNTQPFLAETFKSKIYQNSYSRELLASHKEHNHCPQNDQLCKEAVWFTQNMLLASRNDMERIASAIEKIYQNAEKIKTRSKK